MATASVTYPAALATTREREPESRAGRDPARSDEPVVGRRRPASDVPSVLQHAVEEAARLVGASGAVVCVLDPESGKLKYAHEAGTSRRHIRFWARSVEVNDGTGLISR